MTLLIDFTKARNRKALERATGIEAQVRVAIPRGSSRSIALLSHLFPPLTALEDDARRCATPDKETNYGAPDGFDRPAWLVVVPFDTDEDCKQAIMNGDCAFAVLDQRPDNLRTLTSSWNGNGPYLAFPQGFALARPRLNAWLENRATALRAREPMWAALVRDGTLSMQKRADTGPALLQFN